MKRNNASSTTAKQTSTPCNNARGVLFSKTFTNLSSISNKYRGIRYPIIESPILFDWENSSTEITDSSKTACNPSAELRQARSNTPLKSRGSARISSTVRPLKFRFSSISNSSNIKSRLSDDRRACCTTANKCLQLPGEKPENKKEESADLTKIEKYMLRKRKVETDCIHFSLDEPGREKIYRKGDTKEMECPKTFANFESELSNSSSTTITESVCDRSLLYIKKADAKRENSCQKRKTSTNNLKHQKREFTISRNSITNNKELLKRKKSEWSNADEPEATNSSFVVGTEHKRARKNKEYRTEPKRKFEKELELGKKINKVQSKSPVVEPVSTLGSISCISDKEKAANAKTLKKPRKIKKNAISRGTVTDKRRKYKTLSIYPPTSTPFNSAAVPKEKLPLASKSLSPVKSLEESYKNHSFYDIQITPIKAKKSYAKTAKIDSKFDVEISKWESFLRKPSYQKQNNNCPLETSFSKSKDSSSIRLFESLPYVANEEIPIDDISELPDESRRRKASKSNRQDGVKTRSSARKSNGKKLFQIDNLKELERHFNEISDMSLVIENKKRKKRMKSRIAF